MRTAKSFDRSLSLSWRPKPSRKCKPNYPWEE
jgi:hypothetical protein